MTIVVADLEPSRTRDTWIHLTMAHLGLAPQDGFVAHELVTGQHGNWGQHALARLGPDTEPIRIVHVQLH